MGQTGCFQLLEDLVLPFQHLWYIWALAIWRVLIPYWMNLQYPIVSAVTVAIMVQFVSVDSFAVYRTMGTFPFFVAGVVLKQHGHSRAFWELVSSIEVWISAVIVLLINMLYAIHTAGSFLCIGFFSITFAFRSAPCMTGVASPLSIARLFVLLFFMSWFEFVVE